MRRSKPRNIALPSNRAPFRGLPGSQDAIATTSKITIAPIAKKSAKGTRIPLAAFLGSSSGMLVECCSRFGVTRNQFAFQRLGLRGHRINGHNVVNHNRQAHQTGSLKAVNKIDVHCFVV